MSDTERISTVRTRPTLRRLNSSDGVRLGVVLCVLAAVGFGLVYYVRAIDRLGEQARSNAALNYDDRDVGGGNSLIVDKVVLYEARAYIPEDGTYRVVTGPDVENATELTEPYVDQFVRSFLMPRRPAADARWIICFGCNRAELGRADIVWDDHRGIAIARLRE